MGKKPADQSSNQPNGAGDAVDLEVDLDDNAAGGSDSDEDDDDDDDDEGSADQSTQAIVERAVNAALERAQKQFQSEMDRRINSALAKGAKKPAPKPDEGDEQEQRQAAPAADVRGARIAFREYLPDSIRLVSNEEKALATEYGQNLIRARALNGFDDEDQTGREVAELTAAFLKKARDLYSSRTKRILEKQGALVKPGDGRAPGGDTPPSGLAAAHEAALKKDRELFPHRYAQQ